MPTAVPRGPRARGLDVHVDTTEDRVVRIDLASTSLRRESAFRRVGRGRGSRARSPPWRWGCLPCAPTSARLAVASLRAAMMASAQSGPQDSSPSWSPARRTCSRRRVVGGGSRMARPRSGIARFPVPRDRDRGEVLPRQRPGHLAISSERQLDRTGVDELYVAYLVSTSAPRVPASPCRPSRETAAATGRFLLRQPTCYTSSC